MPTGLGDEQLWLSATNDNTGTSTAFNDQSGNGNNGTASGTLVVADTSEGGTYAYDFDGTNDYISVADSTTMRVDNPNGISISAWVNPDTVTGGDTFSNSNPRYIFSKGDAAPDFNYALRLLGGKVNFTYRDSLNTEYIATTEDSASITTGSWHHIAISGDSSGYTIYVNGIATASTTTGTITKSPINNADDAVAGKEGSFSKRYLDGKLDDLRLYDRTLTQAEITHLASSRGVEGPPPVGLGDEQLWLCPSLNDSANDISGNGNNGTLTGGTAIVSDSGSGGSRSFESYTTSSDRVDVGAGVFADNSDISFSVWVKNKQTSAGTKVRNIFRTTNNSFRIYAYATSYIAVADSASYADGLSSLNTTEYYHYAVNYTHSTGTVEVFRNGVSVGSGTGAGSFTASGSIDLLQNSLAFVDDVRAYNRKLTQAEITHLASSRGVEGPPPVGLGDEQLWLCPSLNDSANDISGNGNDGTYQGGMGTVADTSEGGAYAYSFDGSNDFIDTGSTTVHQNTVFTYAFWLNAPSAGSGTVGAAGSYDTSTASRGPLASNLTTNNKLTFLYQSNGGSYNSQQLLASTVDVYDSTWRHVVCEFDGNNNEVKIYIDGSLDSSTTSFVPNTVNITTSFKVGAGGGGYTNGLMDDVRVYDRTLTQAEIVHLASQRGVEGPPPVGLGDEKLWLCPSLNDSANDISGNGNDGTYQGGMGTVADASNGGTLAYDFDGTDDGIDCPSTTLSGPDFSATCWFYADVLDLQDSLFGNYEYNALQRSWYVAAGSSPQFTTSGSNASSGQNINLTSSQSVSTAQWYHLVATYDDSTNTMELFIDGTSVGTASQPYGVAAFLAPFTVGYTTVQRFNGKMDDIRAYDRVLTQAEITHLATSRGIEGSPSTATQYNAFITHAFKQLFQTRLR